MHSIPPSARRPVGHALAAGLLAAGLCLLAGCTGQRDVEPAAVSAATPAPAAARPVVYQVLTRLFGNTTTNNRPWGTLEENGVGRFADITDAALAGIGELGVTHVWYTGVLHHALIRDYIDYGIDDDDPDVVKGRAGSPYAIKDYYSVNPDLAENPAERLAEFRALIDRTHAHGMRVVIDIVPNHVARHYRSLGAPEGVRDFGADDDTSVVYARDNSFYYIVDTPDVDKGFQVPDFPPGLQPLGGEPHPLADGRFDEFPARWTGNDVRSAQPSVDDWYETVKLNYGVRPDGTLDFERLPESLRGAGAEAHAAFWNGRPVPATWLKMRDITEFWLEQGVDGFRFDMAEMVPVEFWSWLNSGLKAKNPDVFLLAEIYNPALYADFVELGLMDWLYDKVDLYDQLKQVMQGHAGTASLLPVRDRLAALEPHLLRFLENHDEQRIASGEFAGDAAFGRPAMLVTAALGRSATLLYFGQEVGEPGDGDAGFGRASRTTIFDYWGVPAHQRWMNGGRFDGGALTDDERALRGFYTGLMQAVAESSALDGAFRELHGDNLAASEGYDDRLLAWARWDADQRLVALASFDDGEPRALTLRLPAPLLAEWGLADGRYLVHERIGGGQHELDVAGGEGRIELQLAPLAALLLELPR
jgi:glycosidase